MIVRGRIRDLVYREQLSPEEADKLYLTGLNPKSIYSLEIKNKDLEG
jgi:hypothetical protein